MFAKLLKHEWRATCGTLGWMTLAALGVGVYATIALRILSSSFQNGGILNPAVSVSSLGLGLSLGLCILSLCIYVVAVEIILLVRFYRNKYTDEGYLTFTLPVKTEGIYWASFLNIAIWSVISGAVVALVAFLAVWLGTGELANIKAYLDEFLSFFVWDSTYLVLDGIQSLVEAAYSLVLALCCITLGAMLAKKHKILAAFGIYYLISMAQSIIDTILMEVLVYGALEYTMGTDSAMNLYVGIEIAVTLALGVAAYFVTIHFMKKRLNLS